MQRKRILAEIQTRLKWPINNLLPGASREETHRARLLAATGAIIATTGMLFLVIQITITLAVPSLPPAPWTDIVTDIAVVLIGGLTVQLARSGRIRLAAWIALSFLLIAATIQTASQGDPPTNVVGTLGFLLVVAFAVTFLDRRSSRLIFTVAAAAAFIGIHGLWLKGYLPPPMERARNLPGQALFSIISWLGCSGAISIVIGSTVSLLRDQTKTLKLRIAEHRQAEEKLRQRANQLALLNDIGNNIAAELDVDRVLERAIQLVQENFDYHHVALFTVNPDEKALMMGPRAGAFVDFFPPDHQIKLGQGVPGWVGQHAELLLINNVDAEPRYVNLCDDVIPTQSELSVPVRTGQELLGVLDIQTPKRNAFDENDVMVMETLADQIAVAIKNARLYEQAQQEIAERKRADIALRESEERLRTVLENLPVSVFAHDLDGQILLVNEAACKYTGYSRKELLDLSVKDIDPKSLTRDDRTHLWHSLDTGESTKFESMHVRKDGSQYPAEIHLNAVTLGGQTTMLALAFDISKRKQAEEALQESRERYRSLFEDTPIPIWEEDFSAVKTYLDNLRASGVEDFAAHFQEHPEAVIRCTKLVKIIDVNQASLELYGAESKDELLRGLDTFFSEEAHPGFAQELVGIAEGKTRVEVDTTNLTLAGDRKHLVVTWHVIPGYEETLSRCIVSIRDTTERKQAEDALKASKNMLETVLKNMPSGMLLIGEDYKIHEVNHRTCEITGYSEEELIGELCDIVCPKGSASKECPIWKEGRDGFTGMDTAIKCKDGHQNPILKNAQRVTINGATYILENFQDITQRKHAEEQLSFQSMLLDQIQDMVTATDLNGRITYVNEAECRAFGKSADELIGQHVEQYGEDPDRGATQQEIIETTLSEGQWRGEVVNITKAGREIVLDCRTQLVHDENGEPIGMLGVSTDITDRKQTEAALRESEARYRAVVEDQTEFICRFQSKGTLTFVNQAYSRYFNKETGDLIGHGIMPSILEEDRELVKEQFSSLSPDHPVTSYECRVVKPDGEIRWHEWTERAFFDKSGNVIEYQSVGRDITERKEMEQQLRRQERLAAVGQLAAGIAHDFRNLLSTIILYAQLPMRNRDLPPGLTRSLQTIVDESYKATNLVQQILDFSSRAMIKRQPLDLATLTKDVLNILKRTIPEHIQLSLDVQDPDSGAYTVEADSGRIQQALTNLTLNARDAMPDGGDLRFALSKLRISDEETPPIADMSPGDWVCLGVSDTGTGMTKEVREHLFEPFFTTKDVDNGTGLGLAQVYGIVRQHKGHIDVETEPGAGTTFYIYLPAYGEEVEEKDARKEAPDLPQGHGEAILLVEDEKKLREAGRAMLESLGYRVVTAANGREALAKFQSPRWSGERSRPIRLVITDLVMPEMSGEDLMHELQRRKPDLPVLVITGYALQEDDMQAIRDMGFVDIIFKPFEVQALAQAVRRTLTS